MKQVQKCLSQLLSYFYLKIGEKVFLIERNNSILVSKEILLYESFCDKTMEKTMCARGSPISVLVDTQADKSSQCT